MTKLALVLSGGGMGGAAHLGAIKAIEEYNLKPEAVLGTSIGAYVGSVYASGATPDMMIEGWQEISQMEPSDILDLDLKAFGQAVTKFKHAHVTGFLLGRVLTRILTDNYVHIQSFQELSRLSPEERQAQNIKEFYACATNLLDGVETVFCDTTNLLADQNSLDEDGLYQGRRLCHCVSFVDSVRASFSLPAVFVPHKIHFSRSNCPCTKYAPPDSPPYHLYIDGSIKDDYPITIAAKVAQADKIIGINLTKAGAKMDMVLTGGLPEIQARIAQIIGDDQYEADQDDKDVARVDLITIDPAIGTVGVFDMSKGDWLIQRGYEAVKQCFQERGLDPSLSREENLKRLFPPQWVDHCIECGQALPEPVDLGTQDHFEARFTDYAPEADPTTPVKVQNRSNFIRTLENFRRWSWVGALMGLLILFFFGGFQFWWVYQLAEEGNKDGIVFFGGGFIFVLTVLVTSALVGSWLTLLLRNLLKWAQSRT